MTNLVVALVLAGLAPVLVDLLPRVKVPVAVVEVLLGIVAGPQVLGLLHVDAIVDGLSDFGLAFLFFLAGIELDIGRIRGRPLATAVLGWAGTLVLAVPVALVLHAVGLRAAPLYLTLALATTALGALLPALGDAGQLDTPLGRIVMACGSVGEFLPIVCIALLLTPSTNHLRTVLALNVFVIVVLAGVVLARRWRPARFVRLVRQTMHESGQLGVRVSVLLLLALVWLAAEFGLDVLLGSFAAGVIVAQVISTADEEGRAHLASLQVKFEGIGYGFAIPLFFVATGATFDLRALLGSPAALLMMVGFLALFLVVRGLPSALLARRRRLVPTTAPLLLLTATALPLVVTVTDLAVRAKAMSTQVASALVGAAMLSMLLFPVLALELVKRTGRPAVAAEPAR